MLKIQVIVIIVSCFYYTDRANSPALLQNQLSPMFELDPLFKRTFLLALPICDMGKVLKKGKFSLNEICWTLLRVVKEREGPIFLTDEEVTNSFRVSISMGYVTQVVVERSKKCLD